MSTKASRLYFFTNEEVLEMRHLYHVQNKTMAYLSDFYRCSHIVIAKIVKYHERQLPNDLPESQRRPLSKKELSKKSMTHQQSEYSFELKKKKSQFNPEQQLYILTSDQNNIPTTTIAIHLSKQMPETYNTKNLLPDIMDFLLSQ